MRFDQDLKHRPGLTARDADLASERLSGPWLRHPLPIAESPPETRPASDAESASCGQANPRTEEVAISSARTFARAGRIRETTMPCVPLTPVLLPRRHPIQALWTTRVFRPSTKGLALLVGKHLPAPPNAAGRNRND